MNASEADYPDDYQAIQKELEIIPETHRKILLNEVKEIRITEDTPSSYNRNTGILNILKDIEEGELIHELGHAIETKLDLYHNPKFIAVMQAGLPVQEIVPYEHVKFNNTFDFPINTLEIAGVGKFISEYQKRVYDEDIDGDGYFDYATLGFNVKVLGEYFAEGYKYYFINPELLKQKDRALYDFIKNL